MVKVNDRPFLEHLLRYLKNQGITDIVLLVGHRAEVIEQYFGDGQRLGLPPIRYSVETSLLGTGGALWLATPLLADLFFVVNGDTQFPLEYQLLWQDFVERDVSLMVAVTLANLDEGLPGNMRLDEDGFIIAYSKTAPPGSLEYVDGGVALCRKRVLDLIPPNEVISWENEVYPALIQRRDLMAFKVEQPFYDIGTFEGLERARRAIL
jgi:D-glycero-alpha-D-manno-heptose 1-phosphate guanylyltransferase